MSRSAIDKLGKRLAAATVPTEEDWAEYIALQAEWRDALDAVRATVEPIARQEGIPLARVTHRLKTYGTFVEKLRRERTRLSSVRDVGGVRIVCWLRQQERLAARIREAIPGAKTIDRRRKPNHGYRAVHIEVSVDERPIEIQVRSEWQHAWADATERTADVWGRDIRYGAPPIGASDAERAQRAVQLEHWKRAADRIGDVETALRRYSTDPYVEFSGVDEAMEALERELQGCPDLAPLLRRALDDVRSLR